MLLVTAQVFHLSCNSLKSEVCVCVFVVVEFEFNLMNRAVGHLCQENATATSGE